MLNSERMTRIHMYMYVCICTYTPVRTHPQEVIARLCVRPHAHSQLTENICRRWHEHEQFETVSICAEDITECVKL